MRRLTILGSFLAAALVAGSCTDQSVPPTDTAADAELARASSSSARTFTAPIRGDAEVPPRETNAVGSAGFRLSRDGQSLEYLLLIGRLENVTQAHIHLERPGENGPVVAWLYPSAPPAVPIPGEFNGVLGEGVITAANLVGPLAGQPMSALVAAIREGRTYVNVHTQRFPPGEIRGQITHLHVID